jgi:GINS complex subunit 2
VPLWLGMQFKKNKKCRIIPPSWLDTQVLIDKLEVEKKSDGTLAELNYYFYEISMLLLNKYFFFNF